MGFLEGLTLLFIILKLTGNLDWSWWGVLAPLWGSAIVYFLLIIGLLTAAKR